jgi:hypothetical protein
MTNYHCILHHSSNPVTSAFSKPGNRAFQGLAEKLLDYNASKHLPGGFRRCLYATLCSSAGTNARKDDSTSQHSAAPLPCPFLPLAHPTLPARPVYHFSPLCNLTRQTTPGIAETGAKKGPPLVVGSAIWSCELQRATNHISAAVNPFQLCSGL